MAIEHEMRIAFFAIGNPAFLEASLLVRSVRLLKSDIAILQLTDVTTPEVPGVSEVMRFKGLNPGHIMTARVEAFAAVDTSVPTLFLDTDMLMLRVPASLSELTSSCEVTRLCRRYYERNAVFNWRFRGLSFDEHRGKTLDEAFPWLACATFVYRTQFWSKCLQRLHDLRGDYHVWYGDQEAMRQVIEATVTSSNPLCERDFAALPDKIKCQESPYILHFKGASRKILQKAYLNKLLNGQMLNA